ncbi:MAG: two-component system response regulator [Micromonosporaceae bacterium]
MSGDGKAMGKVKILIVDDLEENLFSLEAILGSLGQTLVRARSGEEAMRLALKHDFAAILLDVVMPGLDGFETATMLKRHDKTRDVPIIFLTAAEDSRDSTFRGYAAGAADYITKPFDPWMLRAKLLVFIDLYRKNRMLADVSACLATVEEQMRRLAAEHGCATEEGARAGLGGRPSDQGANALAELAERVALLQVAVRALLPDGELAGVTQPGGLA